MTRALVAVLLLHRKVTLSKEPKKLLCNFLVIKQKLRNCEQVSPRMIRDFNQTSNLSKRSGVNHYNNPNFLRQCCFAVPV